MLLALNACILRRCRYTLCNFLVVRAAAWCMYTMKSMRWLEALCMPTVPTLSWITEVDASCSQHVYCMLSGHLQSRFHISLTALLTLSCHDSSSTIQLAMTVYSFALNHSGMQHLLSSKMRSMQPSVTKDEVGRKHCAALHVCHSKLQLHNKQVQNTLKQYVTTVCITLCLSAQMHDPETRDAEAAW